MKVNFWLSWLIVCAVLFLSGCFCFVYDLEINITSEIYVSSEIQVALCVMKF